ncbi:hypothetical protein O3G_MSEX005222 [Manduca sexta]|uniref:NADH dehydrogenase [ubiquinone] 1 beta subcomplex subunit 4 n=1 Tax=Manduca sexta TaxID=7130 RepID=A0A921Z004_MANSE|nr:hypothetical protein O3G_MSEX005222 [Manduca sexta]
MSTYGFSDLECKIILNQVKRRAKYREEFLRMKSDPCKHSKEAGFVFDPAVQRFLSMKTCYYDTFRPTFKNARFTLLGVIMPMALYGFLVWTERQQFEKDCRCGKIKYRQRMFKFM